MGFYEGRFLTKLSMDCIYILPFFSESPLAFLMEFAVCLGFNFFYSSFFVFLTGVVFWLKRLPPNYEIWLSRFLYYSYSFGCENYSFWLFSNAVYELFCVESVFELTAFVIYSGFSTGFVFLLYTGRTIAFTFLVSVAEFFGMVFVINFTQKV